MKTTISKMIPLAAALLVACGASAQNYSLGQRTINPGGGTSANGPYAMAATVGQPLASAASASGPYSALSGFGALYLLQSTNAPRLEIRRTATNTVLISWPSPSTGWALRQTTNVKTGTWVAPAEPVGDDGAVKFIVVSPPTGNRYYRLVKP